VITPGDLLALQIDKPAAGGRMIARTGGRVVLVAGGIPGERVTARVERVGKGVVYAAVAGIESASPDRRQPTGDPACGGCLYADIAYERQLTLKAAVIADAMGRIGRIRWAPPIVVAPSGEHDYRMRARLHIRNGHIGFFREGTHAVCAARQTRQLLAETCDILDRLASGVVSVSPAVRAEVEVSENIEASDRAVHLHLDPPVDPAALKGAIAPDGLTGLSITAAGSTAAPIIVAGDPYVTDVLTVEGREMALRRHVLAFFQGNRFLLSRLVEHVIRAVDTDGEVVDLYAGVGLFAVGVAAARGARVTAVEGDPASASDLRANAAPFADAIHVVHEPVETFTVRHHRSPSVVIVDPPRTGMSRAARARAVALSARRVVYVSCDVATLARDARVFVDAGYRVERIDGFDLFPNTPHVETIAVFVREDLSP
jgi:23S rRNA (uracil1939-C5)-methyltransferase